MPGKNCGRAGAAPAELAGRGLPGGAGWVQGTWEGKGIREGQETREEKGLWGEGMREGGREWEGKENAGGDGLERRGAESAGNPSGQEDGQPENCGAGKRQRSGVAGRYGKDGGPGEEGFGKTGG